MKNKQWNPVRSEYLGVLNDPAAWGPHVFPDGSWWRPRSPPEPIGFQPNPADWQSWGKTTKATIFVGLKTGRRKGRVPIGEALSERAVYSLTFGVRTFQVGTRYGGSFIKQTGHYIPESAVTPGRERQRREPSLQIVIFPADGESWRTFRTNIRTLAEVYLEEQAQESVIVEFMRDGVIEEVGRFVWRPARGGRKPARHRRGA